MARGDEADLDRLAITLAALLASWWRRRFGMEPAATDQAIPEGARDVPVQRYEELPPPDLRT